MRAEQPDVLARHVRDAAVRAFKSDRDPERRRLLVNRLLDHLDASEDVLLTNAHGEPSLGSELRAELDSADQVDLLCAFVKWHGIRVLEPELKRLYERRVPPASSPPRTWARPNVWGSTASSASSAPR